MPSQPDPDAMRVGTAEREEANRLLSDHFAEGRLTVDEYEARVSAALAATVRADIRELFGDLPAPHPAFLLPPPGFGPPPMSWAPAPRPPMSPATASPKSQVLAGVLQVVLPFGTGRFYTGHTGLAVAQLLVTLLTFGVGALWPLIDGILLLAGGGTDAQGRRLAN
ncbi:DUF1707 domain-containing protein [Amycolatopsis anabasis]|uniref:DUF1707 domain-containing protein n=1 Tax=Amycolatopsis anabasis TaxID=1840409 RepID=UPI00131A9274|nr:DUF1707 domain-containing protein [Amycolatopsis anabasis]